MSCLSLFSYSESSGKLLDCLRSSFYCCPFMYSVEELRFYDIIGVYCIEGVVFGFWSCCFYFYCLFYSSSSLNSKTACLSARISFSVSGWWPPTVTIPWSNPCKTCPTAAPDGIKISCCYLGTSSISSNCLSKWSNWIELSSEPGPFNFSLWLF